MLLPRARRRLRGRRSDACVKYVIGVSTCACVPQLYSDSLRTLQLGSAARIHAFQLPPTSSTRHSCLRTRCLHAYAKSAHIWLLFEFAVASDTARMRP